MKKLLFLLVLGGASVCYGADPYREMNPKVEQACAEYMARLEELIELHEQEGRALELQQSIEVLVRKHTARGEDVGRHRELADGVGVILKEVEERIVQLETASGITKDYV